VSDTNGHNGGPLTPASDGRAAGGRFAPGNKLGRGNPHAKRVNRIRAALMKAVKPEDIRLAAVEIVNQAKAGDLKAFAELLDRTIGRPVPADLEERLAALEQAMQEQRR
jgi:hypothetical protein